jgi:hypothetical protein
MNAASMLPGLHVPASAFGTAGSLRVPTHRAGAGTNAEIISVQYDGCNCNLARHKPPKRGLRGITKWWSVPSFPSWNMDSAWR